MTERNIVVIAHNIRSAYNIGSLFRTCDGLGVNQLFLTGYTPYPRTPTDKRLPHITKRATDQIHKTAIGAEDQVDWNYIEDINKVLNTLKKQGFKVVGLEQSSKSIALNNFETTAKIALVLGEEVAGIDQKIIDECDQLIEIPMLGQKESLNVTIAAAITLYHLRYS